MKNDIFWLCFVSDGFESSYSICNSQEQLEKKKQSFILSVKDRIDSAINQYKHSESDTDVILYEVLNYKDNHYVNSELVPDTFMDIFELTDDIIKDCLQDEEYDVNDYKRNKKYIDIALYDCGLYESNKFESFKIETISAIKEIVDNDKNIIRKIENLSLNENKKRISKTKKFETKKKSVLMEVKRELDFDDLDRFFWSGAKDRWDDATDDQKERVWDLIQEVFMDEIPTETEVNDFVWFECDDIFNEKDDEDEEEFESVRRRRNLRRVIESRRALAKKESLRRRISRK